MYEKTNSTLEVSKLVTSVVIFHIMNYDGGGFMLTRTLDLRQKEVVNIIDGKRLGYVYDIEMDINDGRVDSIIIPGESKFLGLFGKNNDYIIPWSNIIKIGMDIILVEMNEQSSKYIRTNQNKY